MFFPAPEDDLPAVSEEVPALNPNRRFKLVIESKGGAKFNFNSLTYKEVLDRIAWAEPYHYRMVQFEEVDHGPP